MTTNGSHFVFEIVNHDLKEAVVGITAQPLEEIRRELDSIAPSLWRGDDYVVFRVIKSGLSLEEAAVHALEYGNLRPYTVYMAGHAQAGFAHA
jgi:hypothetical protein